MEMIGHHQGLRMNKKIKETLKIILTSDRDADINEASLGHKLVIY